MPDLIQEEKILNNIILTLLTFVLLFYGWDFYSQYSYYSWKNWEQYYVAASASSIIRWKDSWRIESVNERAATLSNKITHIIQSLDNPSQFSTVFSTNPTLQQQVSAASDYRYYQTLLQPPIFYIGCGSTSNQFLRVGEGDFSSNSKSSCNLYCASMTERDHSDPLWMFQVDPVEFTDQVDDDVNVKIVEYDVTEAKYSKYFRRGFSIRNLASNKFISAFPPTDGSEYSKWRLGLMYISPGASETFQLNGRLLNEADSGLDTGNETDPGVVVDDDEIGDDSLAGFLYSAIAQAFLERIVQYTSGNGFEIDQIALHPNYEGVEFIDPLLLVFSPVDKSRIEIAFKSRAISNSISLQSTPLKQPEYVPFDSKVCSIALLIPMTSKGTEMQSASESPVWPNLFSSFLDSIDWHTNTCKFGFFFGFDWGDHLYDTGDAWTEMRSVFHSIAKRHVKYLMEGNEKKADSLIDLYLTLKLMHFEGLNGAPTQIVSLMAMEAEKANYEYFYQVNDDTIIVTPNWPQKFVSVLLNSPLVSNFGMTGPTDTNNHRIFTHAFVHKTHLDIFGYMFAPAFKNWWSDDWISLVYGNSHSFWISDVTVTHNVDSQKSGGTTRYEVDGGSQFVLEMEVASGMLKINQWLIKKGLGLLPLPNICGYYPLAHEMTKSI